MPNLPHATSHLYQYCKLGCFVLLLISVLTACMGEDTAIETESPVSEPVPAPSEQPEPTLPTPTVDPAPTPIYSPQPSPQPTTQPSPQPTPGPSPLPSVLPQPSPVPTALPTPEPSPQPGPSPVIEPSPTPVATPSPEPTPSPAASPSPTPAPVAASLDRGTWTLASSNNEGDLANAIDDTESSRWTTRETQRNGQWLTVNLGGDYWINRVVSTSESSPNDYPRQYEVFVSQDGVDWGDAVVSGTGDNATTDIEFAGVLARHVKIVQLGSSDNFWWSVHDLSVFGSPSSQPLPTPQPTATPSTSPTPTPTVAPSPEPTPTPSASPSPSPEPSAYERGALVYANHCALCHRPLEESDKRNRNAQEISNAIAGVRQMQNIALSSEQIADLVVALNNEPGNIPSPTPTPIPGNGASVEQGYILYQAKGCMLCHGDIAESSKRGAEAVSIRYALDTEVEMEKLDVSDVEVESIVLALADDEGICRSDSDPGPVVMRRLSNNEYINTIRDLLGVTVDIEALPDDSKAGNFTNAGSANVNSEHAIGYAALVPEISPAINDSNNATSQRFVSCNVANDGASCAREVIENLLPLAFRRDISADEVEKFVGIYNTAKELEQSNADALALAVEGILLSPHFNFLIELDENPTDNVNAHSINDFELASRLSYFLWSSMPDETLFNLARNNQLSNGNTLEEQVQRMLADSKSDALMEVFFSQWMNLVEFAKAESTEYDYIDAQLRADMVTETKQLFRNQFLTSERDMRDILTTKTTYLNERLANHYGTQGPSGSGFEETNVSDNRPGILGHASILAATSKENETHPVSRGKWVLDQLLCESPRTPPPDVGELPPSDDPNQTLKEQLREHRRNAACAACHETMDPIGFGLENFDQLGQYRETYHNNHPVDSVGELPDGQTFDGAEDLASILNSDPRYLHCVTEKFFSYARGALAGPKDNCRVKQISEQASASGFTVQALINAIVNDPAFLTRRSADKGAQQ